jgi:diacylglycerol kinase (ATP)
VAAALLITRAAPVWWGVMAMAIGLVIGAELLNTAIETLADHLHPQQHEAIKRTKDVAAGAVLVASTGALVTGVAFVIDQVWPWLQRWLP